MLAPQSLGLGPGPGTLALLTQGPDPRGLARVGQGAAGEAARVLGQLGHAFATGLADEGAKVAVFGGLGAGFGAYAPLMAAMIAASFIGTWIGRYTLERIPERVFRIGFQVLLTALAFRLIWVALASLGSD